MILKILLSILIGLIVATVSWILGHNLMGPLGIICAIFNGLLAGKIVKDIWEID